MYTVGPAHTQLGILKITAAGACLAGVASCTEPGDTHKQLMRHSMPVVAELANGHHAKRCLLAQKGLLACCCSAAMASVKGSNHLSIMLMAVGCLSTAPALRMVASESFHLLIASSTASVSSSACLAQAALTRASSSALRPSVSAIR